MKRIVLLALTALLLLSCQADIIVDEGSEFAGVYKGEYLIVANFSDPGSRITKKQIILWKFTDVNFHCDADTADPNFTAFTCDFYGTYDVETALVLNNVTTKANRVCNSDDFPIGEFSVRWGRDNPDELDSLIMTRFFFEEDEQRLIKLKRLPIEEDEG